MAQSQSHPCLSVLTLKGQGQNQDPDTRKCDLILSFGGTPISVTNGIGVHGVTRRMERDWVEIVIQQSLFRVGGAGEICILGRKAVDFS